MHFAGQNYPLYMVFLETMGKFYVLIDLKFVVYSGTRWVFAHNIGFIEYIEGRWNNFTLRKRDYVRTLKWCKCVPLNYDNISNKVEFLC